MANLYFCFDLSIDVVRYLEFMLQSSKPFYLLIAMQCIVRVSVNCFKLAYGRVVANLGIAIRRNSKILIRTTTGKYNARTYNHNDQICEV